MSSIRVGAPKLPVVPQDQPNRTAAKTHVRTEKPESIELPAVTNEGVKESFISTLATHRQPPKLTLSSMFASGSTSIQAMFSKELEALENRTTDEVAGDLAMAFLTYESVAQKEGDGDLLEAFEEMGELMRGYEHIRMMKTGDLG